MAEYREPGAFYGTNVRGAREAADGGDDRPGGAGRRAEKGANLPGARQIPVEGAVTGPDAPPVDVDEIHGHADLDDLEGTQ